ncbi:MAG TPA: hypothetical protein VD969_02865 [Symbiobacteriaceae bacterium]|nr:hypothetical protein [Symbiobacteriaceae bacterium]
MITSRRAGGGGACGRGEGCTEAGGGAGARSGARMTSDSGLYTVGGLRGGSAAFVREAA